MAFYKNKASQKIGVYAYDSTDGSAKTGDAANISAQISLDGAATAPTNDVAPTELDAVDAPGVYLFDPTQAETNADLIMLAALSATSNILLEPVFIYTEPEQRIAASVTGAVGSVTGAVGSVTGAVGSVSGNVDGSTASVTGAVGSVTGDVGSVAGNVDGSVGSVVGHTNQTADHAASIATILTGTPTMKYMGPRGPGVYVDSGAGNTNTVTGTDGTVDNPVSTFAAARTLADAIGVTRYYLEGNSDITLAATHVDWEFIGVGSVADNIINLGSQDVSRSLFMDLTIEGTQGGAGRIEAIECALQDPGAGATTLHIFALRCGLVDDIEVDTSNNNVFDSCYSLVAGATTPKIIATGAAGTIEIRHYSGGIELSTLSASHNVSIEGMGQVVFTADCNVNANVSIRGLFTITDNTAGMASLTQDAVVNMPKINAEADTAISDASLATAADLLDKLGAVNEAAAAGDPSATESVMQYVKQIVNMIAGTAGIATWPAEAAPGNAVSLAEAIRAIYIDTDVGGAGPWTTALPPKNTALDDIEFLFVAASDHVTPVTSPTGTAVTRSIDGGAFGAGTGTLAEVGNGIMQYDASQADMNGDIITFRFTASGGTPGAADDTFLTIRTDGI